MRNTGRYGDDEMTQEIYNSSTLGPIPLSFTGRRLMQNLREAFVDAITAAKRDGFVEWEEISRARGKLAEYISKLERRNEPPFYERLAALELEVKKLREEYES
jgi:hypothetical protein